MATASITNTFLNAATILASEHNTNFTDLVDFLNTNVLHLDGSKTMTAALPMGTFKITGMGDPTAAQDAATKAYVDSLALAGVVEDVAGAMFTANTETFITATYQDADGTVDLVVPVLDEDDMVSDSATDLATQQSIKAYVGAWSDENPILKAVTTDPTMGSGSVSNGRKITTGKRLKWQGYVEFGTGLNAGSGIYYFDLPVAIAGSPSDNQVVGSVAVESDAAANLWTGVVMLASSGTQLRMVIGRGSAPAFMDHASAGWVAGNWISFDVEYEIA